MKKSDQQFLEIFAKQAEKEACFLTAERFRKIIERLNFLDKEMAHQAIENNCDDD